MDVRPFEICMSKYAFVYDTERGTWMLEIGHELATRRSEMTRRALRRFRKISTRQFGVVILIATKSRLLLESNHSYSPL